MKRQLRKISIFTIIVLLFNFLPLNAMSQQANAETNIDTPRVQEIAKVQHKIVGEVKEKREKNVKTFLLDNMSFESDVYPEAVHYQENGIWKDIDNTLIDEKDENNNDILSNKDNSYKIKIAKNTMSDKLLRIIKGKYEFSWKMDNIQQSLSQVQPLDTSRMNSLPDDQKMKVLTKLSSIVNFYNICPNIDLQYIVKPEQVKENIIINQNVDNPQFIYEIKTVNLIAKLQNDNSIIFYDSNDASKAVFKIEKPVMYDKNYEQSSDINIKLEENDKGYLLTLTPDNNWLSSTDRVYPVTIDPPVSTSLDRTAISDAHVTGTLPTSNFYNSYILKTGNAPHRSYIKFNLPALTSADLVTNAEFYLTSYSANAASRQIDIHKVLGDWNETTITWNNKPAYDDSKIQDYQMVLNANETHTWDITPIVKDWYTTGSNYGVMLKADDETVGYTEYYSADTSSTYEAYWPHVVINYTNNAGLEDYWTYHSQDAGRAGTGYINDFNGNLLFVNNDVSMNGNRMPVTINHVYNSNEKDIDNKYGNGWRLNLAQRLVYDSSISRYVYTDEDGTKHYFVYTGPNAYVDESGINLTMTINGDGKFTVTDKTGNQMIFTSGGYLLNIKDNNGNTISLSYQGTYLKGVTDGAGRTTTFDITSDGYLVGIIDPDPAPDTDPDHNPNLDNRRINFSYTGTKLTSITYPDGKTVNYTYDGNNRLISASDIDGYKVYYTYSTGQSYKVSKAQVYGTDGAAGTYLSMTYGRNSTIFTDNANRKMTYEFNDDGNTVCIKDDDGSAQYYKYFSDSDRIAKNKIKNESKLQKSVVNYLTNHNAETADSWIGGYYTGSTGTTSFATDQKYIGSQSLKVYKSNQTARQYYGQTLTLTKGSTYTFSGYAKTNSVGNLNNEGASLFILYQNSAGVWQTVSSQYINGTQDWQRLEVKFTLPSDSASTTVYARAGIVDNTGTAWFDALQLENGPIANRYNIIENADFKYGTGVPAFWNKNPDCDSNDTLLSAIQNDPGVPGMDRSAFKINGMAAKSKALYQAVNISGDASSPLVVGGWARGDSVPLSSGRYFALDVGLKRNDGTYDWHVIPFNEDSSDWQYASDKITFNPTVNGTAYTSVYVYLIYYENLNTAYFDGIQLYKEEFESQSTLDANGNQTSSTDVLGNTSSAEYDSSTNEVKSTTDPLNHTETYDYTDPNTSTVTHNLYKSVSAAGVVTNYAYDSYGNTTSTTTGDSSGTHITSTLTYTPNGNYISTTTDPSGNTVQFDYDQAKGTLKSETDPNSKTTSYSYNPDNDKLTSVSKAVTDYASKNQSTVSSSYGYTNDNLTSISHNGFSYGFGYDNFGSLANITAAGTTLVTNTYDPATRNLSSVLYGNSQQIDYTYDDLDRVTSIKPDDESSPRFNYTYDASGNLGYKEDLVNGVNYRYIYDLGDRLVKVLDSLGNAISYVFDKGSNTASISDKINGTTYTTQYTYDEDNRPKTVTNNSGKIVTNSYDTVGRLASSSINFETPYDISYSYTAGYGGSSTTKVDTINNNGSTIGYTYDKNGNIATITQNGKVITYYYDELNELSREDNEVLGKTIVYSYDAGGNIQSKTEYPYTTGESLPSPDKVYSYAYDGTWKDLLKSYDGKSLSYDSIGNLTNDGTYQYTWEMGRQLKTISGNGNTITYKYDDNGIRTQKTVNGVTANYHLIGDKVAYESNGTDSIYYTYDSSDNLVSMNLNGVEYYYINNGQGDIIGLLDGNGSQVVSYTYDSWGALKSIDGSLKDTVGVKNPYRYRGYRYDTETGLYYLNSRYYNPEWGRFINADTTEVLKKLGSTDDELTDVNLFAYGGNNPVMNVDLDGDSWSTPALVRTIPAALRWVFGFALAFNSALVINAAGLNPFKYASKKKASKSSDQKKVDKQRKGTPRNNQAQNKQTKDAARKYRLNEEDQRKLHDEVTGQNYTYKEIEKIAEDIARSHRR